MLFYLSFQNAKDWVYSVQHHVCVCGIGMKARACALGKLFTIGGIRSRFLLAPFQAFL